MHKYFVPIKSNVRRSPCNQSRPRVPASYGDQLTHSFCYAISTNLSLIPYLSSFVLFRILSENVKKNAKRPRPTAKSLINEQIRGKWILSLRETENRVDWRRLFSKLNETGRMDIRKTTKAAGALSLRFIRRFFLPHVPGLVEQLLIFQTPKANFQKNRPHQIKNNFSLLFLTQIKFESVFVFILSGLMNKHDCPCCPSGRWSIENVAFWNTFDIKNVCVSAASASASWRPGCESARKQTGELQECARHMTSE